MVTAILFAGCSGDLEKRVAELEGRVAELESRLNPRPAINPVSQNTQPETRPDGPLPTFNFNKEEHDFGTIKEGDVVEHTFTFVNAGEGPLIISNATASCGCTVPQWTKNPVAVGDEGEIKVRFNSKGKPGIQSKTVTINANTYPSVNKLRIKANVTPAAK